MEDSDHLPFLETWTIWSSEYDHSHYKCSLCYRIKQNMTYFVNPAISILAVIPKTSAARNHKKNYFIKGLCGDQGLL